MQEKACLEINDMKELFEYVLDIESNLNKAHITIEEINRGE